MGRNAQADRSMRVIADHLRATTFLIADGILPSNEGRGYVLRRILRRAARHGRLLGVAEPFLHELTGQVVDTMGEAYSELRGAAKTIAEVTQGEEERFIATLDQGLPILNDLVVKAQSPRNVRIWPAKKSLNSTIPMDFPSTSLRKPRENKDCVLDEAGFQRAIDEQRERARKSAGFEVVAAKPIIIELADKIKVSDAISVQLHGNRARRPKYVPTEFVGYEHIEAVSCHSIDRQERPTR